MIFKQSFFGNKKKCEFGLESRNGLLSISDSLKRDLLVPDGVRLATLCILKMDKFKGPGPGCTNQTNGWSVTYLQLWEMAFFWRVDIP
jgi:hypothetical protein